MIFCWNEGTSVPPMATTAPVVNNIRHSRAGSMAAETFAVCISSRLFSCKFSAHEGTKTFELMPRF